MITDFSIPNATVETLTDKITGAISFRITPDENHNGDEIEMSFNISDGQGSVMASGASLTIRAINDAPTAANDTANVLEEGKVSIDVLANDTDVDAGDALTIKSVDSPVMKDGTEVGSAEIITINGQQQIKFTPNNAFDSLSKGQQSEVSIGYEIQDKEGATSIATIKVTVRGENDGPEAENDTATTTENASVNIDVLANDKDADADDALTIKSVDSVVVKDNIEVGTAEIVTINGQQQIRFTPNNAFDSLSKGQQSEVSIGYEIEDNHARILSRSSSIIFSFWTVVYRFNF
jgi:hypothetical protein